MATLELIIQLTKIILGGYVGIFVIWLLIKIERNTRK